MRKIFKQLFLALALTTLSANAAVTGDVNGDGSVNISDVNFIINLILEGEYGTQADLNHDGTVNISDLNTIIGIILGDVPQEEEPARLVGGDISMLTKYEAHYKMARERYNISNVGYYDNSGTRIDELISWLKGQGWNAARVRLFVNPENASHEHMEQGVIQNLDTVKVLGRRIKEAGMKFMLDFHYSDTWADPASQYTPAAWASLDDDALVQQVYEYTRDCLRALKEAGATPDYIQTGNEISYGMLWGPVGTPKNQLIQCFSNSSEANWARFARLLTAAGNACREECPDAKIILHTERVPRPSTLQGFYNYMKNNDVDYDIIGLSYYPYYHGLLNVLNTALRTLQASYPDKDVMIVETGYSYEYDMGGSVDCSSTWPISQQGQRQFTIDLINKLKEFDNVKGLFWWFPEANEYGLGGSNWSTLHVNANWYNAGLWNHKSGRALPALSELKNFVE
jgi:arabinogalactan endo-1,4-beta-galactosidase